MVEHPERHVEAFAAAGAGTIIVHAEATPHVNYVLRSDPRRRAAGPALALNPGTPPEVVREVRAELDQVLCMTVNPGWGGQAFIPASLGQAPPAARAARRRRPSSRSTAGSTRRRPAPCAEAGATLFVAGTAIFGARRPGRRAAPHRAAAAG